MCFLNWLPSSPKFRRVSDLTALKSGIPTWFRTSGRSSSKTCRNFGLQDARCAKSATLHVTCDIREPRWGCRAGGPGRVVPLPLAREGYILTPHWPAQRDSSSSSLNAWWIDPLRSPPSRCWVPPIGWSPDAGGERFQPRSTSARGQGGNYRAIQYRRRARVGLLRASVAPGTPWGCPGASMLRPGLALGQCALEREHWPRGILILQATKMQDSTLGGIEGEAQDSGFPLRCGEEPHHPIGWVSDDR